MVERPWRHACISAAGVVLRSPSAANSCRYLEEIKSPNPAARRGYALAIGALPRALLQPVADQVLLGLAEATKVEGSPGVAQLP